MKMIKKTTFFFTIIITSLLLTNCGGDNDNDSEEANDNVLRTVSFNGEIINLEIGVASSFGELSDTDYNTDLFILSLSRAQAQEVINLDEDLTEEEYDAAVDNIAGEESYTGFYIDAFSDVLDRLSEGTYNQSDSNIAFTFSEAELFIDNETYALFGELEIIQSSVDYYEVRFVGTTSDGMVVIVNFEGDFLYQDFSDAFSRNSAKELQSQNTSKFFLK